MKLPQISMLQQTGSESMYAIIFDFDGTILDTETAEYLAWNEIYNQFGFSLEKENWEHRVGFCGENVFHPLSNLQNLINVEIDIDKLQQNRRAILWGYLSEMKTQPGVIELLEEAKCNNILTGIASSSPSKWVKQHVLRLGIAEYFNSIKCADDVCLLKPNPDLYVSVIKELNVLPESSIAIEDSPPGITAAKRAGMSCVAVPCEMSKGLDLTSADLVLPSLSEFSLDIAQKLALWRLKK